MAETIASAIIPTIVFISAIIILFSHKDMGSEFIKGATEGLNTAVKLVPSLVMLVIGVRILSSSGAVDILAKCLKKPFSLFGIPTELMPVILVRPFSGSAATAVADSLFTSFGPDSMPGLCASILMGASDTIVYTISLYYTSAGIKKTSFSLPVSFIALIFCAILSCRLYSFFF